MEACGGLPCHGPLPICPCYSKTPPGRKLLVQDLGGGTGRLERPVVGTGFHRFWGHLWAWNSVSVGCILKYLFLLCFQMKTVSVALVLCLNVGVDPPDVVKTTPCARLECWIGKCGPSLFMACGESPSRGSGLGRVRPPLTESAGGRHWFAWIWEFISFWTSRTFKVWFVLYRVFQGKLVSNDYGIRAFSPLHLHVIVAMYTLKKWSSCFLCAPRGVPVLPRTACPVPRGRCWGWWALGCCHLAGCFLVCWEIFLQESVLDLTKCFLNIYDIITWLSFLACWCGELHWLNFGC